MNSKLVKLSIVSIAIAEMIGIFGLVGLPIVQKYQENKKPIPSITISKEAQEKIASKAIPESGGENNQPESNLSAIMPEGAVLADESDWTLEDIEARALVANDPVIFYELGKIFEGRYSDVPDSRARAFEWYERAAEMGHMEAQYKMALLFSEDPRMSSMEEAFEYFNKAADQGYAPAEIEVANMYAEGAVVPQDYKRAMAYYVRASNKGNADAELNIGQMYQKGLGVDIDPVKATEYYLKAAEKGQAQAQFNIGVAYYVGYGVKGDIWKAKEWLSKAFMNGNKEAATILKQIVVA